MQETQRKPVLFRRQRSGLAESVSKAVEVNSLEDVAKLLLDIHFDLKLECSHYGYDSRIDWDTYVITLNGDAVGFTNGPLT